VDLVRTRKVALAEQPTSSASLVVDVSTKRSDATATLTVPIVATS